MTQTFILISTVIPLISALIYSRSILKGDARPHRTTRLVLLIIAILSTSALFAQNDRVAIWLSSASLIQGIIIFILSIKFGMGGWSKLDLICLVIALIGIYLWQTTNNPALGLYAAIAADFTGMTPALIKTYHLPNTETWNFYLLDTIAGGFNLLALRNWLPQEFAYPVYIVLINLAMVILVLRPKFKRQLASFF